VFIKVKITIAKLHEYPKNNQIHTYKLTYLQTNTYKDFFDRTQNENLPGGRPISGV